MQYQKFRADQLFTGQKLLGPDQVLITSMDGRVEGILPDSEAGDDIQVYPGIISPGFINCHCHLELSHLKNVVPPHTGLIDFLCDVVTKRGFPQEVIQDAIARADREMHDKGIVAVGDISNTSDTVSVKTKSKIRWHNFIEVLGFTDEKALENIEAYSNVLKVYHDQLPVKNSVLTPHAPYSISSKTFDLINEATEDKVISIHNQECSAEDELYKTGAGDFLRLFKVFGINESPFQVSGKSSLQTYLPKFNRNQTILLIHNTCIPGEDIVFAKQYASENSINLFFCLCVRANLYIENRKPPVDLFLKHDCPLVLGTDSYSSNWELSIAKEIEAVSNMTCFDDLSLEEKTTTIYKMATINGAKALRMDDELGSFEKGKKPGIVNVFSPGNAKRIL